MKNKLQKLIKSTILGTASSILSANAMGDYISIEKFDYLDPSFGNENKDDNHELKFNMKPKLLLFQNELGDWEYNSHRSHRSHSSHRSHYSGSSNSGSSSSGSSNSRSSSSGSTISNSYNSTNATKKVVSSYYNVKFNNNCGENIQILVKYIDATTGGWVTKAWYNINAFDSGYILNTKNTTLYFYAISASYIWEGSDSFTTHEGKTYGLKKMIIDSASFGEYIKVLSCN